MHPMRRVRAWVWRRLEPRVARVVKRVVERDVERIVERIVERAVDRVLERRLKALQEETATAARNAREALRLATEASQAIERILQVELEVWRAIDNLKATENATLLEQ